MYYSVVASNMDIHISMWLGLLMLKLSVVVLNISAYWDPWNPRPNIEDHVDVSSRQAGQGIAITWVKGVDAEGGSGVPSIRDVFARGQRVVALVSVLLVEGRSALSKRDKV